MSAVQCYKLSCMLLALSTFLLDLRRLDHVVCNPALYNIAVCSSVKPSAVGPLLLCGVMFKKHSLLTMPR